MSAKREMSIKKATMINAVSKYSVVIMNILFASILARLLTPDDYGIIAIVTIFTTLFNQLCDMGFASAVIQYRDLDKDSINNIFTFTGIIGLLLAITFVLLGNPIAGFYNNQIYKPICLYLSISVFFNCLNMIPNAVLLREKMFFQVGIRTVVVNIIGYVVAIICAYFGGKYYALVLQSIIVAIANFIWNVYTVKLKFIKKLNMEPIKRVWRYSGFQFVFGWVNYLETNFDNILIGGFLGSTPLAYYDKGYKLISYPMNNISGVVTPVLHPILKDYQDDKETLFNKYVDVQRVLSILSIIITPILFCASDEIIRVVYGTQWLDAVITFQILTISIYPRIMMGTTGAIYCSAGNTKMLLIAGSINAGITCLGIVCGIIGGNINFVAVAVSVANWSNMIVTFIILIKIVLKQSIWTYFKEFIGDIIIMIVMCISTQILFSFVQVQNVFWTLVFKICVVFALYLIYIIFSGKMKYVKKIIKR